MKYQPEKAVNPNTLQHGPTPALVERPRDQDRARADALAALEAACRRVPRRPTPSAVAVPTTALLILPEWLTPIMTGEKTVELRAISSLKRGVRIGFCGSGTGRCWGEATFLHCEGPLDDARLAGRAHEDETRRDRRDDVAIGRRSTSIARRCDREI